MFMTPDRPPSPGARRRTKSVVDRAGATLLLVFVGPWLLLVALAVWLAVDEPVLDRDRRSGQGGRSFDLLRFHTRAWMDRRGELHGLGRLLRDSHLDELPQLLNVVRGHMSFVGPRPRACGGTGHPAAPTADLKPGLIGVLEPEDGSDPDAEAASLVRYAQEWTLRTDLRILWRALRHAADQPGDR